MCRNPKSDEAMISFFAASRFAKERVPFSNNFESTQNFNASGFGVASISTTLTLILIFSIFKVTKSIKQNLDKKVQIHKKMIFKDFLRELLKGETESK